LLPHAYPSLDNGAVFAARIAAMKKFMGEEALTTPTDELHALAELVHQDAMGRPEDHHARVASDTLWKLEALEWARANGEEHVADERIRTDVYRELWSFIRNPPARPTFKTWTQLAEEYDAGRSQPGLARHVAIARYKGLPEIQAKYHAQFTDYRKDHLERMCALIVASKAQKAGVGRLSIEYTPKNIWEISDLKLNSRGTRIVERLIPGGMPISLTARFGKVYIVELQDGKYGYVSPVLDCMLVRDGAFTASGKLDRQGILDSYGLGYKTSSEDGNGVTRPTIYDYAIRTGKLTEPMSIKALMEMQVRASLEKIIETREEQYFDGSVLESLLNLVFPL
jgi:hypothetical protein